MSAEYFQYHDYSQYCLHTPESCSISSELNVQPTEGHSETKTDTRRPCSNGSTSLLSRARTAAYTSITVASPRDPKGYGGGTCERVPQTQIDPQDDPPTYVQAIRDESPPNYVEDMPVSSPLAADARDADESIVGLLWDIHGSLDDGPHSCYSSSSARSRSQEQSMAFMLSLYALLGESERK
ncbi:hypothetical protein L486_04917 [Kwoniella mangroviensis CBS 10435]|uniref:Uncharacterized protein n=1 Tax=Kwoniella mangroviensis CBS 10435 TaxID=1331196 RepID=A0A1B9IPH2_9TREE|nr:hypothetical protein L486_04917 [Kwoniella mangroviensis CBS 10435]